MPQDWEIKVTVDSSSISVDQEQVTADSNDNVKWSSTNGNPFHIQFEDNKTPFDKQSFTYTEATTNHKPRGNAQVGKYKYTVISDANPNLKKDPYIKITNPTL
jgi:hypothetical protein